MEKKIFGEKKKKMKKIFAILATAVLVLTILMSPAYAEGGGETILILSEGSATVNVYSLQIAFIDPLLASTFIGGGSWDYGSIAIDGSGDVYVTFWIGSKCIKKEKE